ncbi:aldo/keto reductase [Granulosicoccus sp.]|nr:aldo/keto reductase [Granulosicoccus sp.]MDB4224129.1 aldo/keto reductase [Granulosicoccus sp.]
MKKRTLGKNGMQASVVAFGAWAIGGWKWGGSDAQASVAAVQASLDAGVDFIDTAAVYGFGLSEEIVGKAIQGRSRNDIVVATKCGLRWDIETPTLHAESEGRRICRTLEPSSIRWEIEQSLQRLGTDYIDLYQTHWPDPETDIESVVESFEALKKEGLIRAWGLCNESAEQLTSAAHLGGMATDQEKYSMLDREQDSSNLPICEEHDLGFLCYSPIAQGLLTGSIDAKRQFATGDLRIDNPRFAPPVLDAIQAVLAPIKSLARDRDITVEQLVLAWTLNQAGVSHVLVGTRDIEQAKSNAMAGSIELDGDEMAMISQAAAAWPGFDALKS